MEENEQKELDGQKPEEKPEEKPVPEVIARRAKGYLGAIVFTFGCGVCLALFGVLVTVLGIVNGGNVPMYVVAAVMALGGVGMSIYSGISLKRISRIPAVILFRLGDELHFCPTEDKVFVCKTNEVTNVSYFQVYGRGQTRPWGMLVVYFGEKAVELPYVKDVVAAHNRLFALTLESKKAQEEEKTQENGENDG